jgi:mRNA interferase YafQ
MYRPKKSKRFNKSYKKLERSGVLSKKVKVDLNFAINILLRKEKLPPNYKDHKLQGKLKKYRECHIKGDILLLYRIDEEGGSLALMNIGSHSVLFQ